MKRADAPKEVIRHLQDKIPKFTDVFDEETFYIVAFFVVILTIIGAFIASRFITLRDVDDFHID